jgi:hypothetical protein
MTELFIVSEKYAEAQGILEKLGEFEDLKIKDQILAKYFELIIKKIRHLGTAQSEEDFDELLLKEIDFNWDMSKIDKWLSVVQLDKDDQLFIGNKTKIMKKRIKQGETVEA